MVTLNDKPLRYFWMVGKAGSIARAGEPLHLSLLRCWRMG